ncbi:alpha/beta fold hydrolase [Rathayibacter sp. VKM Ac-2801]|uniref:alpha/beta hydrolase family protein n=1 Tax=Rathayibacter sp. VKM Ac-2801 TaxID=2609255 RepID=UPI00131F6825|nr:alpha/beta fold hydrolase [Rathayibacter sp. VKM Ac-2801]QHC71514.1 alpha/beta fold hydrolase [Rathayibacter sp. VKM Ac-2801]
MQEAEAREPDEVRRYGEAPEQIVEVFRAAARAGDAARGPVVLVHGGFWRARWDRMHARPLAAALADRGHDVLLPEYRRVGDEGGGWPGTGEDVLAVVEALPALLPGSGPATLVGHSAGGHLAVWSQSAHPSPGVRAVVVLAGVLDLTAASAARLSDDAVGELLGGDHTLLAEADPARLPPPPQPTTLIHGALDDTVPVEYSRRYSARHRSVNLHELADAGHLDLVDPTGPAFTALLAALA